jgi:serine protease Do
MLSFKFFSSLTLGLVWLAGGVLLSNGLVQAQSGLSIPATEIAKIASDITVLIDGQYPGSGVIIYKSGKTYTVLTALHVIQHSYLHYEVVTSDRQRYPVNYETVKKLAGVDLATLEFTSDRSYKVAKLANSDQAVIGSVVYTAGFPDPGTAIQDRTFQFTDGEISARPQPQADGYALVYTNTTRAGMSGGPVLDAAGRLVGIHGRAESNSIGNNQSGQSVTGKAGLNLAVPINTFLQLAPKAGIKFTLQADNTPPTASGSPPNIAPPTFNSPSALPIPIRPTQFMDDGLICGGRQC